MHAPGPRATADDKIWQLGSRLFFDASLSASGATSCATCHWPSRSWSDDKPKAIGDGGRQLAFRAPTLINAGGLERLGWTGRFRDSAAVAFFAMNSPTNMNLPTGALIDRLRADPSYVEAFHAAFPGRPIDMATVGAALTRFVNSIVSSEAPFDRWIAGDETAIPAQAKRGFDVFEGKGKCAGCHSGWTFTDGSFHDIGIAGDADLGRGALFKTSIKLQHAFKTPTLRNVADRAPYMHDGSKASLEEVVELYDRGGIDRPSRAEDVRPLHLTAEEKRDLVAFLKTLSSKTDFVVEGD